RGSRCARAPTRPPCSGRRSPAEPGPGRVRVARTSFPHGTSCPNEISAAGASGDLARTVALEHTTASVNGAPPQPKPGAAADPRPTPSRTVTAAVNWHAGVRAPVTEVARNE